MRENLRDLLGIVRAKEKFGVAFIEFAEAEIMWLYDARIIRNSMAWQYGSKVCDILLIEGSEVLTFEVVLPILEANCPLQYFHYEINYPSIKVCIKLLNCEE